jgi:hypothetical protein
MADKPIQCGDQFVMPGTRAYFMLDDTLPISDVILYRFALAMGGVDVHYQVVNHEKGFKYRLAADYSGKQYVGEWCTYRAIAILEVAPYKFAGTTEYFDGFLPRCFRIDEPYFTDTRLKTDD